MQRGSSIWIRTLSLQVGQRASLLECASIVVWQRGHWRLMGIDAESVPCSSSPGFGAKIAIAPAAMVAPATKMDAMAMSRTKSSSRDPNPSKMMPKVTIATRIIAEMSAVRLMIRNARSGTLRGTMINRWAAAQPMIRKMLPGL